MFQNYIKLALRNLWKSKSFSAINIVGLSLGMAVCITILLFVQYEKNFDGMHTKNIYRLNELQSPEGMAAPQKVALSMCPMGPALKADFPEVKNYARLVSFEMAGLANNEKKVFLDNVFWTDASFFDLFDFKLLKGDRKSALANENSVVLTEESAEKLFGKEDPIGKSLSTHNMRDTIHFTVTGILQDIPENSHLQFDGLYSLTTIVKPASESDSWGGNWMITYLELSDNADIKKLESRFPAFLTKYMNKEITKELSLFLQPVKNLHATSSDITHDYFNYQKFDRSYTNLFSVIAVIVLLIACINFINLSTARSASRAKEVGVRKSIGAHRQQLVFQFLSESMLLAFTSMLLATILVTLFLPYLNLLTEHDMQFLPWKSPLMFFELLLATVIVGILAGLYPAFYLSSFKPVFVLKGVFQSKNKSYMRNSLVIGQFASATFLIIATVFVIRQLNFMRSKELGFNKDQVITISGAYGGFTRLKAALEAGPLVKGVSGSSQSLGNNLHQSSFKYKGDGPARDLSSSSIIVDEDFISLYEIKMIAGKNFTEHGNGKEFIINKSLAKELLKDKPNSSYESLIGDTFMVDFQDTGNDSVSTIVGIVEDFNFNSLHTKVETLALVNYRTRGFHDISVKIDAAKVREAIAFVESTYKKNISSYPFSYIFLDEHFATLYKNDMKVSRVVAGLGILAVIIACLGLLGLALHSAETRTKEIGVRKVLGASVTNIVQLLSKDFVKLVLIANLIAWPLAWWIMSLWLRNYAYHINLSWWVFVLAGIISLAIAVLSVSSQTFRAASANPAKSLRTE
ncbi:ABC transporter permease [Sphingobacteriaceae bacterium]|nr:ABC transporter permease [Sphingobacteriaceae bacterium]